MRAADLGDRLDEVLAVGQQVGDAGLRLGEREQDVLGRDVLVAEAGRLLLGLLQDPDELARGADVGDGVAAQLGQLVRSPRGPGRAASCGIDAEALQDRHDDALVLLEQGERAGGAGRPRGSSSRRRAAARRRRPPGT